MYETVIIASFYKILPFPRTVDRILGIGDSNPAVY